MPLTAPPDAQVKTGGDALRMILDSDTLLIGCIAFALLAMVTVSRVAARRRKDRSIRRESHARTQAIHEFLERVREGTASTNQGVWHYDYATGDQHFSDDLMALVGSDEALTASGAEFVRLARQNSNAVEPYEAEFEIEAPEAATRCFTLHACNIRNGEGQVQHAVAIVREIEAEIGRTLSAD